MTTPQEDDDQLFVIMTGNPLHGFAVWLPAFPELTDTIASGFEAKGDWWVVPAFDRAEVNDPIPTHSHPLGAVLHHRRSGPGSPGRWIYLGPRGGKDMYWFKARPDDVGSLVDWDPASATELAAES